MLRVAWQSRLTSTSHPPDHAPRNTHHDSLHFPLSVVSPRGLESRVMGILCRWILVLTLLPAAGVRLWAASAADRAFDAATNAFHDTFYDRAEAGFADFRQKFPASPRLAEAILLQAEARLELTNYAGAIELLSGHQSAAGTNADQYLFWLAEAYARKGDYQAASDGFARLVKEVPASSDLSGHQSAAGTKADQYLFWLAEAYARKGDYQAASDGFARLVKEFPAS